jgi:hypothetical protein
MNDRQEAKLSMYQEVAKVCHANEAVYALDTGNSDLLALTSVNKSTFYGGHVNDALKRF